VVASNWGKEIHPDWFNNLMHHPQTTIQVRATSIPVEAYQAQGEEYKRLWELVTSQNGQYLQYQKGMVRQIPIVILKPTSQP
jgi:deazaflavin-dependent oxidoreductase (nitroreductase family)